MQGKLGYLKNPRLRLRRVARFVSELIAQPCAKQVITAAGVVAEVSGVDKAAKGLGGVADLIGGSQTSQYRPPFVELGPAVLPVHRLALTETFPGAQAPPGSIMVLERVRFGKPSTSWLSVGGEDKLEREALTRHTDRQRRAKKARAAQHRFLSS